MRPNIHNAERRAALRRLRRAQLAEARRIRRGLPHPPGRRRRLHPDTGAPVRPLPRPPARRGPPGGDIPDARADALAARDAEFPARRIGHRDHSTVLHGVAVIAARLDSGRQGDVYLRHMVRSIGATLDATYDIEGAPIDASRRAA